MLNRSTGEAGGNVARFELVLERGIEPIRGELRADAQPARTFVGMLELMSLLDAARVRPLAYPTGEP